MSQQKAAPHAKFDKTKRLTMFDEKMKLGSIQPGQGAYKASSEFGQYDGDVYGANSARTK